MWEVGDGRLLFSIHGARILGCEFPVAGDIGNLFWHDPALEDAAKLKPILDSRGMITAGDRLWIAPEVGFMWPDLAGARIDLFKSYRLPPEMDPADYHIAEESAGHLRLVSEIALTDYRMRKRIRIWASRQFDVTQAPYGLPAGIKSLSFVIRNNLTLLEADAGAVAGAWDILQLRGGGELICPTVRPAVSPRCYFAPFGDDHVRVDGNIVRFRVDGKRHMKMGLSPLETTGRMGYLRRTSEVTTLIVRIFAPLPGEPYVDLPPSESGYFGGDALQAYNGGTPTGTPGEMEYHTPALVAGKTPTKQSSSCITHVLAGDDKAIREVGRMLLGVDV